MSIHFAPPSVPKASIGSWGAADRGAIFFAAAACLESRWNLLCWKPREPKIDGRGQHTHQGKAQGKDRIRLTQSSHQPARRKTSR